MMASKEGKGMLEKLHTSKVFSKVETLAGHHASSIPPEHNKRLISDIKDMIYQNEIILKPVIDHEHLLE